MGKYRTKLTSKIIRSCGENVNVEKGASFTPELFIGDNSGIGINSEIYGPVFIGNNVLMGPEVIIYTQNHSYSKKSVLIRNQGYDDYKKVVIEDDVWIGRRAMIKPGSHIGKGAVFAAGSVVSGNVPEYAVVGGVPAKVIKYRKWGLSMKRLLCIISCMNTGGAETFLMKMFRYIDRYLYMMDFCVIS